MSVARPTDTGCRLVRIKRVPSSEFHQVPRRQQSASASASVPASASRCLPPVALRLRSVTAGGYNQRVRMAHQRHSELWLGTAHLAGHLAAESSPCAARFHQHQVAPIKVASRAFQSRLILIHQTRLQIGQPPPDVSQLICIVLPLKVTLRSPVFFFFLFALFLFAFESFNRPRATHFKCAYLAKIVIRALWKGCLFIFLNIFNNKEDSA